MNYAKKTRRVALSGMLVALMLIMGYVESLVPLTTGVPGIKPGLSNGVLIFAVYMLDVPLTYCLMILKVLLTGLMFGGISAMLYSFAGGLLSLTAMCLLKMIPGIRPEIVGMAGGMLHNVGQTVLAMVILHTYSLIGYLGVLIPVGIACGLLTGFLARLVMRHLKSSGAVAADMRGKRSIVPVILAVLLFLLTAYVIYSGNPFLHPHAADQTVVDWGGAEDLSIELN